jgi:UDP-N-acetylglucosamine/UDP-N-acetylgalactosamine diphosphorylase
VDRALLSRLEAADQHWILDYLAGLPEQSAKRLQSQLSRIDLEVIAEILAGRGIADSQTGELKSLPIAASDPKAKRAGEAALKAGEVGFVILAGGQASRLRAEGPKGAFPIGPKSDRSLFAILVHQILRAGRDAGVIPLLAITTSSSTDAAIRAFFEEHKCFDYPRDKLSFSCQKQLPALSDEGRLILASPERVFTNPDGHGGALQGLETNGVLPRWESAGIRHVACCQVDNPILQVVDPEFIGRSIVNNVPLATKIVVKTDPAEKVGVVASLDGRPALVEYSDLSDEDTARRDADGQLTYRLGSIAVHVFALEFLRRELPRSLPLHVARKEIPCVDHEGNATKTPGRKFERFLFDLFPSAENIVVCEVDRELEFEPLKNAEGAHSPDAVRTSLDRQYRRWYAEAGVEVPDDSPLELLELSPLDVNSPADLEQ